MLWQNSILPKKFYARDPETVAKELLGTLLVRKIGKEYRIGMITETEAYLAAGDEAAHNFKGKTKRTESLYKDAGHAYIYQTRHHHILDVVTEGIDIPSSVLIRGLEPIEGITIPTNGPAKLCKALSITKALDGIDMTDPTSELFIAKGDSKIIHEVLTSGRIGISKAKDMPLRFYISGNIHVSKMRKSNLT